jgi:hypothetical protein
MTTNGEIVSLEKFILDNSDLEKLEFFLCQFNIFDVLNIAHAEIRHSSVNRHSMAA